MKKSTTHILMMTCLAILISCQTIHYEPSSGKDPSTVDPQPPVPVILEVDYTKTNLGELARKSGILLGAAFTRQEYLKNPQVAEILTREFKSVTFGNEMKHDAIVRTDGTLVFDTADQMVEWARNTDTEIFGHVLGWHSQQQKAYLDGLVKQASTGGDAYPVNPAAISGSIDFENFAVGASSQLLDSSVFLLINGPQYVSVTDEFAHSGSRSLKMDNADAHASQSWDVQVVTKAFPVTAGKTYRIAWYARASRSADIQIDIRGDGDVQYMNSAWGNFARMGTEWTCQYLDYTVQSGKELSLGFYGATEAVTYYLDDIQLFPKEAASGDPARKAIDAAFKSFVFGMVEHFDPYAWDVVNETFTESGAFRTQGDKPDNFVWGSYYDNTRAWVDTAFAYATAAAAQYGKKPVLYINDYNLETSAAKRKAFCEYARNNPQVTGVASQMHLDMATPDLQAKIEASLKDLTATGKMVRISELDLKNNNENAQAEMIKFIFQKYLEIVPTSQRGGITFWGINDKDSWVGENNHPLLWKGTRYEKKEAYKVLYIYLCELNGINPYKE